MKHTSVLYVLQTVILSGKRTMTMTALILKWNVVDDGDCQFESGARDDVKIA